MKMIDPDEIHQTQSISVFYVFLFAQKGLLKVRNTVHVLYYDSLAEWSKALVLGTSPQGRGFEPHSCHFFFGLFLVHLR
jgi:hypothetical protein